MTLIQNPPKAILNRSIFKEAILIFMHQVNNNILQSVFQQFTDNLENTIFEIKVIYEELILSIKTLAL
jgi:hypothetical protein